MPGSNPSSATCRLCDLRQVTRHLWASGPLLCDGALTPCMTVEEALRAGRGGQPRARPALAASASAALVTQVLPS